MIAWGPDDSMKARQIPRATRIALGVALGLYTLGLALGLLWALGVWS